MNRISGHHRHRHDRPVAAAILLSLAGLIVLASALAFASAAELGVALAASSTSSALVIGGGLLACGISTYAQPHSRILTGLLGFVLALVAIPAANFGGGLIGTALALFGSAAALSWESESAFYLPEDPDYDDFAAQRRQTPHSATNT